MIMKVKNKMFVLLSAVFVSLFLGTAQAQGLSGLEDMTTLLEEIFAWARTFVIAVASLYFMYLVVMAFLERKTWNDVIIGVCWCIFASGSALLAEWAVAYFS